MKKILSTVFILYIVYLIMILNRIAIFVFDRDIIIMSCGFLINILFFGIYIYAVFSTRWEDKKFFNKIASIFILINTLILIYYVGMIVFLFIGLIMIFVLWNRSRRFNKIVSAIILMAYLGIIVISVLYIIFELALVSDSEITRYQDNKIIVKHYTSLHTKGSITYERIFFGVYKVIDSESEHI